MNCIKFFAFLLAFCFASHSNIAQSYKRLAEDGQEYYLNNEYEKAIPAYKASIANLELKLQKKQKAKWLDDLQYLYHDLGVSLMNTGRNEAAEQILKKAFNYGKQIHLTSDDHKKAFLLDLAGHLGDLYVGLGLYYQAEEVLDVALSKYSRGELALAYKHSETNLALDLFYYEFLKSIIKLNQNDFENARYHIRKQNKILHSINFGFDAELKWPKAFNTYARILFNEKHDDYYKGVIGGWNGSIERFSFQFDRNDEQNAMDYFVDHYGSGNKYHVNSIISLVRRKLHHNKPQEAFTLLDELTASIKNRETLLPELQANLLLTEAYIMFRLEKLEKADELFRQSIELKEAYYEKNLYFLSLDEQARFWQKFKEDLNDYFEFNLAYLEAYPQKSKQILQNIIELQAKNKGRILQSALLLKKTIYDQQDRLLIKEYEELARLKRQYATQSNAINVSPDQPSVKHTLAELQKEINLKERRLFSRISTYQQPVSYDAIQQGLRDDEILVEIVRVTTPRFFKQEVEKSRVYSRSTGKTYQNHTRDSTTYLAVFVEKNEDPVHLILKNVDSLDDQSLKYYKNAIRYKIQDTKSYSNYMQAIDSLTKNKKTIYFSPDGVYHLINPNSIWNPTKGCFLYEDKQFIKITNPKDILTTEDEHQAERDIYLFGRPDFGKKGNIETGDRSLASLQSTPISDLPGTEEEVITIKNLVQRELKVYTHMSKQASEENIMSVTNPKYLHIATHGYFFPSNAQRLSDMDKMIRSGLLLSGVLNTNKKASDGILTSLEASLMNLEATDLVVLSACETGQGEVDNGEGVYGLQRGLALAGANYTLMSLWKVDDQATKDFMIHFYEALIRKNDVTLAYQEAMTQTKLTYKHPYYWGAFALLKN